jgi:hypothetical protein
MAVDGLKHEALPSALLLRQPSVRRDRPTLPRKPQASERLDATQAVAVEWDDGGQRRVWCGGWEYEKGRTKGISHVKRVMARGWIAAD